LKIVVLFSVVFLTACALAAPTSGCTRQKADSMTQKLKDWVVEETARMNSTNASLQELTAGLERTRAMEDRVQTLSELSAANDLEGLCRETRAFAADYGFSVE
jgi:uncharacterized protein YlxW (UPF0749 family)